MQAEGMVEIEGPVGLAVEGYLAIRISKHACETE
jgi:hypothetical protein